MRPEDSPVRKYTALRLEFQSGKSPVKTNFQKKFCTNYKLLFLLKFETWSKVKLSLMAYGTVTVYS